MAADYGDARSTTKLRPPPPFGYPHLPRPVQPHHHHHHPYGHHHQLQPQPQPRMFEPEPEPYVKMEPEWEQEWEWRGKQEYVDPGEAEGEWWEQYERPPTQDEVQEEEPMQAEGRAIVCSMFCMSP